MYKLGIDLGGTNIVAGVVDDNYNILATGKLKTNAPRPAEEIIDDMVAAAKTAIENAGLKIEDIDSMGVGSPGAIDPVNGVVCFSNNLEFYNVPMAAMLKERMGVDFYIENDANSAAYGEFIAGAGRGTNNFIAITLGTGVGGGVIIDGKMLVGANGAGGEIGHLCVNYEETDHCGCGNRGCLEQYASATGIVRLAKQKLGQEMRPTILNKQDVTAKDVFDAVKAGDEVAKEIAVVFGKYLGYALANLAAVTDPAVFVIGGGVSKAGEVLIPYIREPYMERAFFANKNVRFVLARLGNDAGICGAAKLVLDNE